MGFAANWTLKGHDEPRLVQPAIRERAHALIRSERLDAGRRIRREDAAYGGVVVAEFSRPALPCWPVGREQPRLSDCAVCGAARGTCGRAAEFPVFSSRTGGYF